MNKTVVPIKGLHCRSCEILVAEKLESLAGVKSARVDFRKKSAVIYSKSLIDHDLVVGAIEDAGYGVGLDEHGKWLTADLSTYRDLLIALACVVLLYFLGKALGLGSLAPGGNAKSSLGAVLVVGLTAGISTCMALVGGLILGLSAKFSEAHPEASPTEKFRPHLFFNLGRISSYVVLGGLIGLIGQAFQFSGSTLGFLTILVGLVMFVLGLQLTEISPRLASFSLTLPAGISRALGIHKSSKGEYSHSGALVAGALTFFLPCGFTQAMQLYAMSTGSFTRGATIMGIFALGTVPGLLGIGGVTSAIKGVFAKRFFKFAGVIVVALAVVNISNGFNLAGLRPGTGAVSASSTPSSAKSVASAPAADGYQVIKMEQSARGYTPKNLVVKKNIPVKWIINSTDSNTCAASIYAQSLHVQKFLEPGENTIEFTPTQSGTINFSCSMGMYRGTIQVE